MNKLKLNKKTVSQMNRNEMANVNGGKLFPCLVSCPSGTLKLKSCCDIDDIESDYIIA